MVSDRRPVSLGAAVHGRRTSARAATAVPGRDPVGAPHGGPLERFTKIVSVVSHVLAAAEGVVGVRHVPARLGARVAQTRRPGTNQLAGSDRRWHVCVGKKGGACVGKTKRGKGT